MIETDPHIAKARRFLQTARYLMSGDFDEMAGRDADAPKTHRGLHNRFSVFAKDDPRVGVDFVTFLSRAVVIKNSADHSTEVNVTKSQAEATIASATMFVDTITAIISPTP